MGDDFASFLSCLDAEEILLYCGAKRKIGVFADGTRTEEDLYRAIANYQSRQRRFGKTEQQIEDQNKLANNSTR